MPRFPDYPSEHDPIPGVVSIDGYDRTNPQWHSRDVVRIWHLDEKKFGLRITASWGTQGGHECSSVNVIVEKGEYRGRPSPRVKVYYCEPCEPEKVGELITQLAREYAPTTKV